MELKEENLYNNIIIAAEFIVLALCSKEVKLLRNLLIEILIWPKPMPLVSIHSDSEATLLRAYNQIYNGRSRHISLRHSNMRQFITDRVITINKRLCKGHCIKNF